MVPPSGMTEETAAAQAQRRVLFGHRGGISCVKAGEPGTEFGVACRFSAVDMSRTAAQIPASKSHTADGMAAAATTSACTHEKSRRLLT